MNANILAGSLLTGLVLAAPISAQQVSAGVVVRSGPVARHVIVDHGYSTYRRRPEARRVVVVERHAPRVIVVERVRRPWHADYWRRHGYRQVTIYVVDGRYYDRYVRGDHVREIVVYERDGRFYDPDGRDHR